MDDPLLDEQFGSSLDPRLTWLNPPAHGRVDSARGVLVVEPAARTDFWRKTHYGFEADNGHFLHLPVGGDFVLTTKVWFVPVHQYDQAGLMVRVSPSCWLKTSVEYEPDGPSRLGAVVTNAGYSDWSTQEFEAGRDHLWLRIRRESTDYAVESSLDGARWVQIRMAHLHEDTPGARVQCGLYACSPTGGGFVAEFSSLQVRVATR